MLSNRHVKTDRRGMILLVVLAMLTMFTVIGITFVYLSDAIALASNNAKIAENILVPNIDPEAALSYVMGQLIYDVNDDNSGIYSSLRGHSLARNMYGWNHNPASPTSYSPNDAAYNGVGRLRYTNTAVPGSFRTGTDDMMINYYYYQADGFRRDPERLKAATDAATARGSFMSVARSLAPTRTITTYSWPLSIPAMVRLSVPRSTGLGFSAR